MNGFAAWTSRLFGLALIGLSIFVSVETVSRKLFNFSFEGADELGGYVLAVGSSLAFVVALVDRSHIRIDVLYARFPARVQRIMDWLSIMSLACLGLFIVYVGRIVIVDTIAYGSTAPTPWATPLIWPQSIWLITSATFPIAGVILTIRAVQLLLRGDWRGIGREFGTISPEEELQAELEDLKRREAGTPVLEGATR